MSSCPLYPGVGEVGLHYVALVHYVHVHHLHVHHVHVHHVYVRHVYVHHVNVHHVMQTSYLSRPVRPAVSIMTNRMACEHPDIISAAISVGGPLEVTYNHPCPDMLP